MVRDGFGQKRIVVQKGELLARRARPRALQRPGRAADAVGGGQSARSRARRRRLHGLLAADGRRRPCPAKATPASAWPSRRNGGLTWQPQPGPGARAASTKAPPTRSPSSTTRAACTSATWRRRSWAASRRSRTAICATRATLGSMRTTACSWRAATTAVATWNAPARLLRTSTTARTRCRSRSFPTSRSTFSARCPTASQIPNTATCTQCGRGTIRRASFPGEPDAHRRRRRHVRRLARIAAPTWETRLETRGGFEKTVIQLFTRTSIPARPRSRQAESSINRIWPSDASGEIYVSNFGERLFRDQRTRATAASAFTPSDLTDGEQVAFGTDFRRRS